MYRCVRNHSWPLTLTLCLALVSATAMGQEAPAPTEKEARPVVEKPTNEPTISLDGTVPEFSSWAKGMTSGEFENWKLGHGEYRFPAITDPCPTKEEATLQLDSALEKAMTEFLFSRMGNRDTAQRLTPPAATIRNLYLVNDLPEVEKREQDGATTYRAALQLRIKEQELVQLTDRDRRRRQGNAVFQTLYVGGGVFAFVTILAIQARLNHATEGRRNGILRAASTIAILSLLVGLFISAVLGRVFAS